jgi:hypothetical protein
MYWKHLLDCGAAFGLQTVIAERILLLLYKHVKKCIAVARTVCFFTIGVIELVLCFQLQDV